MHTYFITTYVCRQEWMRLQDLIATRSKSLAGAYEIHKFNSDAEEILGRIQVSKAVIYAASVYTYNHIMCVRMYLRKCIYVHNVCM